MFENHPPNDEGTAAIADNPERDQALEGQGQQAPPTADTSQPGTPPAAKKKTHYRRYAISELTSDQAKKIS